MPGVSKMSGRFGVAFGHPLATRTFIQKLPRFQCHTSCFVGVLARVGTPCTWDCVIIRATKHTDVTAAPHYTRRPQSGIGANPGLIFGLPSLQTYLRSFVAIHLLQHKNQGCLGRFVTLLKQQSTRVFPLAVREINRAGLGVGLLGWYRNPGNASGSMERH